MYQWLIAKYYDRIMRDVEDKGLREWRCALLNNLVGDVMELGCGTGANLDFYPNTLNRLVLMEPSVPMYQKLQAKLVGYCKMNVEISNGCAEDIPFPDASFDNVVCTLVLCSVKHLEQALSEIHRVLRPQGKLIFIEHVAATTNTKRYRWQRRLALLWKCIAAGCCITRQTEKAIHQAGFKFIEINRQSMRGVPPIVRPSIRGVAVKN